MQCTPHEIKEKLLKALDEDNNVVDMVGVLAVITALENYPITREALEQTRIGKYINELRKKTSDEQLAKRAKKLVRNWQKLINQPQSSDSNTVNGDKDNGERIIAKHPQISSIQGNKTGSCPNSPAFANKHLSPALNKPGTPRLASPALTKAGGQRLVSPALNKTSVQKLVSPSIINKTDITNMCNRSSLAKPGSSGKPTTPTLQQPPSRGSKPNTPKHVLHTNKPNTPTMPVQQQQKTKSKPNTPSSPQYCKERLSPHINLRSDSPKHHSTPKTVNSPKIPSRANSIHASPVVSPESSLGRPPTPSDGTSTSRPGTPLSGGSVSGMDTSNRLPRNLSHDNLTNFSHSSHGPAEEKKENGKTNHSNEVSPSMIKSTNSPSKLVKPDQSLNVKTNVANKKRSREDLVLTPSSSEKPHKASKTHHSGVSSNGSYKKVLNGSLTLSEDKNLTDSVFHSSDVTADIRASFSCKRNVNLAVKTDTPKLPDRGSLSAKTPKVKTTAQLIAELQAKSGSSALGRNVIKQIETNQIKKEDDEPESVLPPGMGRKRRQKHTDFTPDVSTPIRRVNLSQTKTELVEKFLQSSVTPSSTEDLSPFKFDMNKSESPFMPGKDDSSMEVDVTDSSAGDLSFRPAEVKAEENIDTDYNNFPKGEAQPKTQTLEEIYDMLPPINYDVIQEEETEESITVREINNEVLERLQTENWEGVNGCENNKNEWCDWTQTLSRLSYNDDLLHILPYVLIDD